MAELHEPLTVCWGDELSILNGKHEELLADYIAILVEFGVTRHAVHLECVEHAGQCLLGGAFFDGRLDQVHDVVVVSRPLSESWPVFALYLASNPFADGT